MVGGIKMEEDETRRIHDLRGQFWGWGPDLPKSGTGAFTKRSFRSSYRARQRRSETPLLVYFVQCLHRVPPLLPGCIVVFNCGTAKPLLAYIIVLHPINTM